MKSGTIRQYQADGVSRMIEMNRDVILADEPGLGKTIQAAELINRTRPGSVLIVCPASLRLNWAKELEAWLAYHPYDLDIVSYESLVNNGNRPEVDLAVFDEAHYLKNPEAKRTSLCLSQKAGRRLFLTGTPVVNRPMDLFPVLKAMGSAMSRTEFGKRYCAGHLQVVKWNPRTHKPMKTVWDFSGASNTEELNASLRKTCMIRRTKAEVLKELPNKVRQVIDIEAPHGESLSLRNAVTAMFTGLESASENVGELKKIAFQEMSAARLETAQRKLPFVISYLKDLLEEGKVVVFAYHREVIEAISSAVPGAVYLYGGMSDKAKDAAVRAFQEGRSSCFVGQITAAGTGITLTAASTVLFAEIDWVPGNMTQAEDRCHRIGQTETVRVIHLTLADSVDGRMIRALVEKQEIIEKVMK